MFQYEFMTNAFAAAGIVAVVSGIVGYFLVMRGQTFAGHALSHIGFAGATGAGLIGLAPLWGLLGFTLAAGIVMGALSDRISNRDVAIGVVLALALGFGLLFLHYYTSFATQATALLFGNVLAVDHGMIATLAALGVVTLVALAVIMRPLIFATLQPELAEAKGVPMRFISTAFLAIVAAAILVAVVSYLGARILLAARPRGAARRDAKKATRLVAYLTQAHLAAQLAADQAKAHAQGTRPNYESAVRAAEEAWMQVICAYWRGFSLVRPDEQPDIDAINRITLAALSDRFACFLRSCGSR